MGYEVGCSGGLQYNFYHLGILNKRRILTHRHFSLFASIRKVADAAGKISRIFGFSSAPPWPLAHCCGSETRQQELRKGVLSSPRLNTHDCASMKLATEGPAASSALLPSLVFYLSQPIYAFFLPYLSTCSLCALPYCTLGWFVYSDMFVCHLVAFECV